MKLDIIYTVITDDVCPWYRSSLRWPGYHAWKTVYHNCVMSASNYN